MTESENNCKCTGHVEKVIVRILGSQGGKGETGPQGELDPTDKEFIAQKTQEAAEAATGAEIAKVKAEESRVAAEASQKAAEASQIAAKASEDAAAESAAQSKTSEGAAGNSATVAANAESGARTAASASVVSAGEAEKAAGVAGQAKADAVAAKDAAEVAQAGAETSAASAKDSADKAAAALKDTQAEKTDALAKIDATVTQAKSDIQAQVTVATAQATTATQAATTATQKATEADQSAKDAEASKAAAETAKASAEASATTAAEQAGIATEKAEEAKNVAVVNRIVETASGEGMVRVDNSADYPIESLTIYGKSVQDGTPTLDDPKEIIDVVNPTISIYGRNLMRTQLPYKVTASDGELTILSGANVFKFFNEKQWNTLKGKRIANIVTVSLKNAVFDRTTSANKEARIGFESTVLLKDGTNSFNVRSWKTIELAQQNKTLTGTYTQVTLEKIPDKDAKQIKTAFFYVQGCVSGEVEITDAQIEVLPDDVQTASDYEAYKAEQTTVANYTLRSLGDYKDELIVRNDGTGKFIKRIEKCYLLRGAGSYFKDVALDFWTASEARFLLADPSVFGTYPNNLIFNFATQTTFCDKPYQAFRSSPPYLGLIFSADYIKEKYGLTWSVPPTSEETSAISVELKKDILALGDRAYCYAVYQNPVVTELTKDQVDAILQGAKSNKPTTTIINDQGFGMEIEYTCDPKNYIDQKISELQALTLEK